MRGVDELIVRAAAAGRRLGSAAVTGVEVLLGALDGDAGAARSALHRCGVTIAQVFEASANQAGPPAETGGWRLTVSPDASQLLHRAYRFALAHGRDHPDAADVLVAVLWGEPVSPAVSVLEECGLSTGQVAAALRREGVPVPDLPLPRWGEVACGPRVAVPGALADEVMHHLTHALGPGTSGGGRLPARVASDPTRAAPDDRARLAGVSGPRVAAPADALWALGRRRGGDEDCLHPLQMPATRRAVAALAIAILVVGCTSSEPSDLPPAKTPVDPSFSGTPRPPRTSPRCRRRAPRPRRPPARGPVPQMTSSWSPRPSRPPPSPPSATRSTSPTRRCRSLLARHDGRTHAARQRRQTTGRRRPQPGLRSRSRPGGTSSNGSCWVLVHLEWLCPRRRVRGMLINERRGLHGPSTATARCATPSFLREAPARKRLATGARPQLTHPDDSVRACKMRSAASAR